ncbi:hypothetical protein N8D56_05125 [Devosia sp. A8/3-2]|nr:hypothetical protein N8D56_05125 [Devosia sp. A8/3-2]
MLTSIIQSAAAGWIWRRAQELGSLATVLIPIYLAMPPHMQEDVRAIFAGQGGGLTISAAVGLLWYLWTQWQSYRATTVAQVVTAAGEKILPKPGSAAMERVETQAKAAPKRQTLWERLTGN